MLIVKHPNLLTGTSDIMMKGWSTVKQEMRWAADPPHQLCLGAKIIGLQKP